MFVYNHILFIFIYLCIAVIQTCKRELLGSAVPIHQLGRDVQPHLVVFVIVPHKQRPVRHVEEGLVGQAKGVGGDRIRCCAIIV